MQNEEKELLTLSCFDTRCLCEIPNGWYGIYLANPKGRYKRYQANDSFVDWLSKTHELTFSNFKTIGYGEFYIFQVDNTMKLWAESKMKELERKNLGIHFRESIQYHSWFDCVQS